VAGGVEAVVKIAVLNGPNLNMLGVREPDVYGTETLAEINRKLAKVAKALGVNLVVSQHNSEGDFIQAIQSLHNKADGILINAAAYTHTSLALVDALRAVALPYVEVHLSNIFSREPVRQHSLLAAGASGVICGFGSYGYELALHALVKHLQSRG
jgi:3-dehydroquinate dehydratase-2